MTDSEIRLTQLDSVTTDEIEGRCWLPNAEIFVEPGKIPDGKVVAGISEDGVQLWIEGRKGDYYTVAQGTMAPSAAVELAMLLLEAAAHIERGNDRDPTRLVNHDRLAEDLDEILEVVEESWSATAEGKG